jgi:phosphoserine phosphatase
MESKNIKLVVFDLDKTLIKQNSWYKLNLALGITEEQDQTMLDAYNRGEFSYDDWMQKIFDLYKQHGKANLKNITDVLANCYTYREDAKEIIEYLRPKYKLAIISGSIDILVDMVAKDLSIDLAEATNSFVFDADDQLIKIVTEEDTLAKLNHLENFCKKLNLDISECACIGDGDNDILMFKKTGNGITFSDSKIKADAREVIESLSDLKNIL